MNFNQFPNAYKLQHDSQIKQEIIDENSRSDSKITSIKNSMGKEPDVSAWAGYSLVAGFFIGFFVCCSFCMKRDNINAVGSMILIPIGATILGAIIGASAKSRYKGTISDAKSEEDAERNRNASAVQSIKDRAAKDYRDYLSGFEAEAQKMSVQFAESALAIKVIDWMTKGYEKTIDSQDRSSHIEQINIPFSFNVYTNKITCNLGTFDFELERCRELTGPLEQTALARAIASSIQLNITMRYPKDASGTDIVTNISYSYGGGLVGGYRDSDHVAVIITYTAPNGNYKSVQSW